MSFYDDADEIMWTSVTRDARFGSITEASAKLIRCYIENTSGVQKIRNGTGNELQTQFLICVRGEYPVKIGDFVQVTKLKGKYFDGKKLEVLAVESYGSGFLEGKELKA